MKTIKVFLIALILALLPGCAETRTTLAQNNGVSDTRTIEVKPSETPRDTGASEVEQPKTSESIDSDRIIKGTIGLVVLREGYQLKDPIRIYNPDGSVWLEFELSDDSKVRYEADDFKPVILDTERYSLVLKCTGQDKTRYEVLVNDETGLKRYVRKNDKNLRFETWEAYVLGLFAVGIDEKTNPILETPAGTVKQNIPQPLKEWPLHPVETRGDWMRIEWDENPNRPGKGKKDSGWIRWRDEEKIVVELFQMA